MTSYAGDHFPVRQPPLALYSLSSAHANDWCDAEKRVQTSAGLLVSYGGGAILGLVLSSIVK